MAHEAAEVPGRPSAERVSTDALKRMGPGCVHVKDWWHGPDDRTYMVIVGELAVMSAESALGFPGTRGVDSNWCLEVSGSEHRVYVLGCQVRTVTLGLVPSPGANYYVVP